jgi:hypothetical protein
VASARPRSAQSGNAQTGKSSGEILSECAYRPWTRANFRGHNWFFRAQQQRRLYALWEGIDGLFCDLCHSERRVFFLCPVNGPSAETAHSASAESQKVSSLFFALAVFVLLLFLLWLLSNYIPPLGFGKGVAVYIESPQFTRGVLGVFFGAFFVLWIRRIWAVKDQSKVPFYLSVEGVLLLCLLLAGTQDAFKPFFQRLTGLKLGPAELSFSAGGGKSQPVRSSKTIIAQAADSETNGSSPVGLVLLANLGRMMRFDYETYMPTIAKSEYEEFHGPNKSDKWEEFTKPNTIDFIDRYIVSLAYCYRDIIKETHNTELMDDSVRQLMRPFAELAAISKNYNMSTPLPYQVEGPIHELTQILGSSIIQADEFVRTIERKPPDQQNDLCANFQGGFAPNVPVCRPADERAKELGKTLDQELTRSLTGDPEFVNRPYFALAYAALASLNHLAPAGFFELDDWAQKGEKKVEWLMEKEKSSGERAKRANNENNKNIKELSKQMWFNARVRLNLYTLMEEWLRKGPEVPYIYHEYHFYNLRAAIDDLNKITYISKYVDRFGKLDKPLSPNFDTYANDNKCDTGDDVHEERDHVVVNVNYNIWLTSLDLKINYMEKAATIYLTTEAGSSIVAP